MMRLSAIFIAACMLVIAASLGAVLYLRFGFGGSEAAIVTLAVLTALALYDGVSARLRARNEAGERVTELSRSTGELARQVADYGRRLTAVEARVDAAVERAAAMTQPLSEEIGELGGLIKELAETVAAHENLFVTQGRPAAASAAVAAPPSAAEVANEPEPAPQAADLEDGAEAARAFRRLGEDAVESLLRSAVEANRLELHLQPIMTLPQRKVRYYEALSRLKTDDGEVVAAADFIDVAERLGLVARIDELAIFRCVQVLRRLLLKNRDVGLFCNLSPSTLVAPNFPQLIEFLDDNRAIAPSLIFEFAQAAVRAMGPIEQESLAALASRGFRFSIDHVDDLRIEARELADRGFRFIKAPAGLLLGRINPAASDIHPADLSDLLGRFGIDLIAGEVESEGTVVDLLDYELRFGQGVLFAPPRPVRAEVLQGVADTRDAGSPRPAGEPAEGAAPVARRARA